MAQSQVAIIGTGLIGASIGFNLMAKKDRGYLVLGADRDRNAVRTAKKLGMKTVWVTSAARTPGYVDASIPNLRQLPRMLAQLQC